MRRIGSWVPFIAIMFALSPTQRAVGDELSGAYVGGNFGRARILYDTGFIDGQIGQAATSDGDTLDFSARSIQKMSDVWWADVGYFLTPYVGLDAAFMRLGDMKYAASGRLTGSIGDEAISTWNEVSSRGPALSLVLRVPLAESFEADLRLGDYYGKTTYDNALFLGSKSMFTRTSKSDSSLLAGVGGAYTIAGHWSLRLDLLRINQTGDGNATGKFSVNLATAGVSFTF